MLKKTALFKAKKPDLSPDVGEDLLELIFIEISSGFVKKNDTTGELQQIVRRIKEKK